VRTTNCAPSGPNCGETPDRYICQPGLPSNTTLRTSATTPMTRHPCRSRLQSGQSGLAQAKACERMVSLMMTTPIFLSLSSH